MSIKKVNMLNLYFMLTFAHSKQYKQKLGSHPHRRHR